MKKFFNDLSSLQLFVRNIDLQRDHLHCEQCSSGDFFVAHDFIYKKQHNGLKKIVGQRLFCSNRYGRKGCGSTFRLYLATIVPTLRYTALNISLFLKSLLDNNSIQKAYNVATNRDDPRNAYRWLNKLYHSLSRYRVSIKRFTETAPQQMHRRKLLRILLSTIYDLFNTTEYYSCTHYQQIVQEGFI